MSKTKGYQCVVIRYIENKLVTGWFGVEEVQTTGWEDRLQRCIL